MPRFDLSFASREDSLSVRHFAVREPISDLFEVSILARSPLDEIDLESIVGQGAAFALESGTLHVSVHARAWTGICNHMELVQAEPTGLSTYFLTIVPTLWRTTLRKNSRIFQHMTLPAIVSKVLDEWKIEPEMRLDEQYPTLEYLVQYGETDFAFLNRLLEEAGITYFFTFDGSKSTLVLADRPQQGEGRRGGPLLFVDNPNLAAQREYVEKVKLGQRVTPGRFTVRDFDFRNQLDYQLFSEARARAAAETPYEHYEYVPGAFWFEPGKGGDTPVADDKGVARTDETEGQRLVQGKLDAARRTRRLVSFETNVIDLAPGSIMAIDHHPRKDFSDKRLLVVASELEGEPASDWKIKGEAVFADAVYRPERRTPRPRIEGVQSAVVVGPPGEEIHTDELGRVRVQFHWDREGRYDDFSSCWIRVNQGWAGAGYGMLNLPRVGQEVLVEFFEGDPNRPVITGRVFSATRRVLYKLPDDKTKSGWKTETSPGAGGFNELSFEDAADNEVIHVQAQKDFSEIVKNDQVSTVLHDRFASVTNNDGVTVGNDQSFSVVHDQSHTIGKNQSNDFGDSRDSHVAHEDTIDAGDVITGTVGPGVGYLFKSDQTIFYTNGVASITLTPKGLFIDAKGDVHVNAGGTLKLSGKQVIFDGKPNVYFNRGPGPGLDAKRTRLLERLALIDAAQRKAASLPPGPDRDRLQAAGMRLARNNRAVEHARLAENVYQSSGAPESWQRVREWSSPSGFYAVAYRSEIDGRTVVAFRGTQPKTWQSWLLGNDQNVGLPSPQYAEATVVAREAQARFGNDVEFTGHSLGGGLAATAAMATGQHADTFNAAGIHPLSYVYYGLNPLHADSIDNYHVKGDILTGAQTTLPLPEAVGHSHSLDATRMERDEQGKPKLDALGYPIFDESPSLNPFLHPFESVDRHSRYVDGLELQKTEDTKTIQGML